MNGYFGKSHPGQLEALDHLDADRAAAGTEIHIVIGVAPNQPKVAVDVAYMDPEREPDQPAVDVSDDDSMQRVRAAYLVAVDYIDIVGHQRHKSFELANVVLRVSVGVKDQLL